MPESLEGRLIGKRILLTLTHGEALKFALEKLGAMADALPLIHLAPPEDFEPLDSALQHLDHFDSVIFTSANTVEAVTERLSNLGVAWPEVGPEIAAIGQSTLAACAAAGLPEGWLPERNDSIGIIDVFGDGPSRTVLLPQSALADSALAEGIEAAGHKVIRVTAYRPVHDNFNIRRAAAGLAQAAFDAVLVGSPSNLQALLSAVDPTVIPQPVICLGQTTAKACEENGIQAVASSSPDVDAVTATIRHVLSS